MDRRRRGGSSLWASLIVIVLVVLLGNASQSLAQEVMSVETKVLNIRAEASIQAEIVGKLFKDNQVIVLGEKADSATKMSWKYVMTAEGKIGFVVSKWLKSVKPKTNFTIWSNFLTLLPGKNINLSYSGDISAGARFLAYPLGKDYLPDMDPLAIRTKGEAIELELISKGEWDITLSPPPLGLYSLLMIDDDRPLDHIILLVTKLGLIYKASDENILVHSVDLLTGEPIGQVKVKIWEGGEKDEVAPPLTGITNADGIFFGDLPTNITYINVMGDKGEHLAFTPEPLYRYYEVPSPYISYTYTDRPIYRPNNAVNIKGIVREKIENSYIPYEGEVQVVVKDQRGNKLADYKLTTNDYGTFATNFILGEEPPLGVYSILTIVKEKESRAYFEVKEYRKPEYEVAVNIGSEYYISEDTLSAEVEAKYFFGEPVSNAKVEYFLIPGWYMWRYWDYDQDQEAQELRDKYWFADYQYWDLYERGFFLGDVPLGTMVTDEKGRVAIQQKVPKVERDRYYRLVVRVSDSSNRIVYGSSQFAVTQGEFHISADPDKYRHSLGDTVKVTVSARDYEDQPISTYLEAKVSVNYYIVQKDEKKKTKKWVRKADVLWRGSLRTDEEGKANFQFIVNHGGWLSVDLESQDERGNKITSREYLGWVSSREIYTARSMYPQIITDRYVYQPGDVATITVQLPFGGDNTAALFTVEGRKLFSGKLLRITGDSLSFELPIASEYQPNIYLDVCLVRNGEFISGAATVIYIPTLDKELAVEIEPDKPLYRPGEEAEFTLYTTRGGKPVPAELSLGVVDNAIYAMQEDIAPDIWRFFWGARYNRVSTDYSWRAPYGAEMGGGEGGEAGAITPRRDFKDTAYWVAQVRTDSEGKAIVRFRWPDNITSWRATARAVTKDTAVGSLIVNTTTKKDLFVRLITPRFLTQGDKLSIGTIIHNYTSTPQEVSATFEGERVTVLDTEKRTFTIEPGGVATSLWPISVDKVGKAVLTAKVWSDTLSDGMELTLPILPHGLAKLDHQGGSITGDSELKLDFSVPEGIITEASQLKIKLSPSLVGPIFTSLEYLVGYPYGCVEQTMSRFLPDVVVDQVVKALGISNPHLEELPAMVSSGLQRLYAFQHGDGGWGWWKRDDTKPYMTAYVIYGLTLAREADYLVEENVIKRGIISLQNQLKKTEDLDTRAFIIYALSLTDSPAQEGALYLYSYTSRLSDYGKALLAMSLQEIRPDLSQEILERLRKTAISDLTGVHWGAALQRYRWIDNSVETTAYILQAFLELAPEDEIIPDIIHWLVANRRNAHWGSTKNTAATIISLAKYLRQSGELSPSYSVDLLLNGELLRTIRIEAEDLYKAGLELAIPASQLLKGHNSVGLKMKGTGRLYYSLDLEYLLPQEHLEASSQGIKVSRAYSNPISKVGETTKVTLMIDAESDYRYVVIEDRLPSGYEVVNVWGGVAKWDYWYVRNDIRDTKVVFFATNLRKGLHLLAYSLRAELPGHYIALPAQAEMMYAPHIRGNSAESKLLVGEE